MSLHDLQTAFMQSVFSADDTAVAAYLDATPETAGRRMTIYRNNIYVALTKALETIYPVIGRLVGEDFFKFAAKAYIERHPSRSGDLNRYGEHFTAFLEQFEHAAQLPYLPDVARLEWACHQVYSAADDATLNLANLAKIPPHTYGRLHFRLNNAARLLRSPWPVDAIWEVNQADYIGDQAVNLATGGVNLLIQRHERRVTLTALGEAEWRFLYALDDRQPLDYAFEQALSAVPDTDLGALLQTCVATTTLADFSLSSQ